MAFMRRMPAGLNHRPRTPLLLAVPLVAVAFVACILTSADTLNLLAHPAGDRALLGHRNGLISLVSLPPAGSGQAMSVLDTWLDLRGRVDTFSEEGLVGMAFHPKFAINGRFFVSYTCDPIKNADCRPPAVPCQCGFLRGCRRQCKVCPTTTIVAEYSVSPTGCSGTQAANATRPALCGAVQPLAATSVTATEVRKILAFGRPYSNHVSGPIYFDSHGYFYFNSGDGGFENDPCNFAQNGEALFGKVLRLSVDNIPSGKTYDIPGDNPFVGNPNVRPEVYALGLRNPWRCDYDAVSDSIVCGEVGENNREEVNVIVPGGNYGWACFEGTAKLKSCRNLQKQGRGFILPAVEIPHPTMECIIGGVVYRGADSCLYGKYLYNDLYGMFYISNILPYTFNITTSYSNVTGQCASSSPIACDKTAPLGAQLWGWGKDLLNNAYVLSNAGIFRLLPSSQCGGTCS